MEKMKRKMINLVGTVVEQALETLDRIEETLERVVVEETLVEGKKVTRVKLEWQKKIKYVITPKSLIAGKL